MSPSERERSVGAVGKIADVAEPLEETADVVDALGIIINVAEVLGNMKQCYRATRLLSRCCRCG